MTSLNKKFYSELINRFFNPKSYFYSCFIKYLNQIDASLTVDSEDENLILRKLIEKITSSFLPIEELGKLASIVEFNSFNENLEKKISASDLLHADKEKMKQLIEEISQFVFNELKLILENPIAKNDLRRYLNIESKEFSDKKDDQQSEALNETVIPIKIEESILETPVEKNDFRQFLSIASEEVPDKKEDQESHALDETVISIKTEDSILEKPVMKNDSRPFLSPKRKEGSDKKDKQQSQALNETAIPIKTEVKSSNDGDLSLNSPAPIDPLFVEEIKKILIMIDQGSVQSKKKNNDTQIFSKWNNFSQELKFVSMLYGYEEVEAIADQTLRLISKVRNLKLKSNDSIQQLFQSIHDIIQNLIEGSCNSSEVASFISALGNYDFDFINQHTPEEENKNSKVDVTTVTVPAINQDFDRDFKLPGEDDQELLSLIDEVIESKKETQFRVLDKEEVDVDLDETIVQNVAVRPSLIPEIDKKEDDSIKFLNSETSIYFKIINSALKKLVTNNSDRSAIEDIELASSSLNNHAMKFGFEKLSQLPRTIEELATKSITRELQIPVNIMRLIAEAIILLQTFADDELNRKKFKQIHKELNQHLVRITNVRKKQEEILF
jgi:hypothetical protein